MRTDRLLILLLISLSILIPLLMLPFMNKNVVATVEEIIAERPDDLRDGPPVKMLAGPMLGPGGRKGRAVYISVDLPSPSAVDRLCQLVPAFIDGFHVYATENPDKMDPTRASTRRDLNLINALRRTVPTVPLDAVRVIEMHQYLKLTQAPDVYLCQGLIAQPTIEPGS